MCKHETEIFTLSSDAKILLLIIDFQSVNFRLNYMLAMYSKSLYLII